VRIDVVQVAPDVQGLVTRVAWSTTSRCTRVTCCSRSTRRYALAVRDAEDAIAQANAGIESASVALAEAQREAKRNHGWAIWCRWK
jgi:multidrug resistance efflux pump